MQAQWNSKCIFSSYLCILRFSLSITLKVKKKKRREGGREKQRNQKKLFQSHHIIYYIKHHTFSSLQACIESLFGSVWNCVFKNLTIIALKLNHLYVLQDQMVQVGVCLQALCIRFFSCFLVQSWIFQLTKKAMRNEKRLDFTDPWTIRLHSTVILRTYSSQGLGPKK